jgi:hypothetical protein
MVHCHWLAAVTPQLDDLEGASENAGGFEVESVSGIALVIVI